MLVWKSPHDLDPHSRLGTTPDHTRRDGDNGSVITLNCRGQNTNCGKALLRCVKSIQDCSTSCWLMYQWNQPSSFNNLTVTHLVKSSATINRASWYSRASSSTLRSKCSKALSLSKKC